MRTLQFILLMLCCQSIAIADMPREVWVKDAEEMSGGYTIVGKKTRLERDLLWSPLLPCTRGETRIRAND
jgi:hypothetical protein